jgi:hypothetical protein
VDEDQEMLLSRRRLLATGAIAAAGVMLPQASASATTPAGASKAKPLARYSRTGYRRSRFAPHVGGSIELRPRSGAAVRGTLLAVEDVPYVASLAGHEDVYTLRFRGPARPVAPEGIMAIRHKAFGVVELYVSAVPSAAGVQDYLAAINRHVPRGAGRALRR